MVGAQSGIPGSLPANAAYSGTPAIPHKNWLKSMAVVSNLPDLRKTVATLEKRIASLEAALQEK
jgi:UDP-3-O-[3-hydroxymyristoyl] glucosamine N-acyltransferase